jgi:DNA-binding CsgD family transcriptional regulator
MVEIIVQAIASRKAMAFACIRSRYCLSSLKKSSKLLPTSKIGAQLKLASNTVSTYRARILEKTGTKNDVELALYAQQHSRSTSER